MELEALRSDMIAAMKAKDKARKEAISSLISAAKKIAIDEGCRDDIKPELVDRVILKELKTVKEQIDTCPASREDLKAEYQFRYDVISEYAPKQMSADEVMSLSRCGSGGLAAGAECKYHAESKDQCKYFFHLTVLLIPRRA